jgi:soluble lytic murein transglycosylase-like protein
MQLRRDQSLWVSFVNGLRLFLSFHCTLLQFTPIFINMLMKKVMHFTDAPTDNRFKIYMRDIKKDKKLRTNFKLAACGRNPEEFAQIINSLSTEYGVDKSLIKAVIHAESGYNPNAVSPKGAKGLMQLMPKTAQDLKVCDTFNPKDNIRGGVRYLRFLLDTFKGDVSLALAAYNAGLSRVSRYGGTFEETRNYVAKVLSYQKLIKTIKAFKVY